MALYNSPKVATDGLVFYYDMGNAKRSWKGQPTTNLIPDPEFKNQIWSTWSGRGENSWSYGTFDGSTVVYTDYTIDVGASHHLFRDVTVSSSLTVYSLSIEMFVTSDCDASGPFMNEEYPFGNTYSGGVGYDTSKKGTWQRVVAVRDNAYTGNTGNIQTRLRFYFGGGAGTRGRIYFRNAQLEANSYPTPFVSGSRSNTQAILDLTGKNTITVNSLTYNSDGSFSFDNSNDVIETNFPAQTLNASTICAWVYDNTADTNYRAIVQNNTAGDDALYVNPSNNLMWWPATSSSLTVPRNQWVFVAASHTYGTGILYQVNETQQFISGTFSDPTDWDFLRVGGHSTGDSERWGGYISVVQVYSRALSAIELQQNFNALRGRYGI